MVLPDWNQILPLVPVMRWAVAGGLVAAMLVFGVGVFHAAALLSNERHIVHRPTEVFAPSLPGTMYVVQGGAIYRFQHGKFTQITSGAGWTQPSVMPDNQLVAVRGARAIPISMR